MAYFVRFNDNKMQVFTEVDKKLCLQREALAGDQLLDFIYYDLRELNRALDHAYSLATSVKDINFQLIFKELDADNIYLRFFSELFLDTLLLDQTDSKAGFKQLCERFPNEINLLKQRQEYSKVTYRTISKSFLIGVFSLHASGMQQFMKSQLEFCLNSSNEKLYQALTTTQKLYLYEQWRNAKGEQPLYFETDIFSSRLVMSQHIDLQDDFSLEKLAEQLQMQGSEIYEMTVLSNGWALMRYELMKMVTQGVVVKICAHCGRYFIPDGRSDMEYCSRPLADQPGKTCQDIGAMVRMQNKIKNDPIFMEYTKAYKRNNSRVRMGKMSQTKFLQWSDEARVLRDQCVAGELEQAAFFEWLNKDRKYKKQDIS